MGNENNSIKSTLLSLYDKGICANEALKEINTLYGQNSISKTTVYRWFGKFKSGNRTLDDKFIAGPKAKLTDEFLIDLITKYPDLSMGKLARLADTSAMTISRRLKKINKNGERVNYVSKKVSSNGSKLTSEFLINLINDNPDLNMTELARLTGTSATTISNMIKQINGDGEKVRYTSKGSKKGSSKLTDERLIELVSNNPDLSMKELAKLANISVTTIGNRIRQINSSGERIVYINKSPNNKSSKLTDEVLIDLINENPNLNMEELAELVGVSQQSLSRRINKINRNGERAKYISKKIQIDKLQADQKSYQKPKFTDEFLIDLINENPDLSIRKLSKLAGTSSTTICERLKQVNSNGERVNYRRKDVLNYTDESLINLVNENSGLSMKELANLIDTSIFVLSKRIKQINWVDAGVNYSNKLSK